MPALIFSVALLRFASPGMVLISLLLLALLLVLAVILRPSIPWFGWILALIGAICFAAASGEPRWRSVTRDGVLVMVDLSASTRGAEYRSPAALQRRIDQLVGKIPYRVRYFAQGHQDRVEAISTLPDLPGEQTIFNPPPGNAILLFSDGRFALPDTAPPTYIVIDPLLESPGDVAVANLEQRPDALAAHVRNAQSAQASLTVIPSVGRPYSAPPGDTTLLLPVREDTLLSVRAESNDRWPENNTMSVRTPPATRTDRWWVSTRGGPGGWRSFAPAELPADPASYLAAALLVLDNVSAADLAPAQQQLLVRHVRDLGGGLMILGGERAFAAGQYHGTPLEWLSPLASTPPVPTVHWVILADASGSMAGPASGATKWEHARRAVTELLPRLPARDAVSVGSFANSIDWWSQGRPAEETAAMVLPPRDVRPNGPTNLEAALAALTVTADELPREVLLLTDGQGAIEQFEALRRSLTVRRIRLHVLAIGEDNSQLTRLLELSKLTGGLSLRELDPEKWIQATRRLFAMVASSQISHDPLPIVFVGDAAHLPRRSVAPWNQVFLKRGAGPLAESADGKNILAARWSVGVGTVIAAAFSPSSQELDVLANLAARPPRDPRYKIRWDSARQVRVTIDAMDGQQYLNGLDFQLDIRPEEGMPSSVPVLQIAPGQYQGSVQSPVSPAILTIRHEKNWVDHFPVPGRYPAEFDNIGNDHHAMRELASRTGGRVIPPADIAPIAFPSPKREKSLVFALAAAGGLLLSAFLIIWRRFT